MFYAFHGIWHARLDSGLLSSWAQLPTSMYIGDSALKVPGLDGFLARANSLASVSVHCSSLLAAAKYDGLLGRSLSITKLTSSGLYCPCVFPQSLQVLDLDLSQLSMDSRPLQAGNRLLEMLVVRLKLAQLSLRALTLNFVSSATAGHAVDLECHATLPHLEELTVMLAFPDSVAGFDWLCTQPCTRLSLEVEVMWRERVDHERLLHELRRLQLRGCTLNFNKTFTKPIQEVWQHFALPAGQLRLSFWDRLEEITALPRCPRLYLLVGGCPIGGTLTLQWAALVWAQGCVHIDCSQPVTEQATIQRLQVIGCPGHHSIEIWQHPWQLEVHGLGSFQVSGLPASQPCMKATYLWQNQAAIAAGWAEGMLLN